MITQAELKRVLRYVKSTGKFYWRVDTRSRAFAGDEAGGLSSQGYVRITWQGVKYTAHQLAVLYVTGEWPKMVDHRNGVRYDNVWRNLRASSARHNGENRRTANSNNRTGLLGVSFSGSPVNPFRATVRVNGAKVNLGQYRTAHRAHRAYVKAKRRLHAGCTI